MTRDFWWTKSRFKCNCGVNVWRFKTCWWSKSHSRGMKIIKGQIDLHPLWIGGAPVRPVLRRGRRAISLQVITSNLIPVPALPIMYLQLLPTRAGNGFSHKWKLMCFKVKVRAIWPPLSLSEMFSFRHFTMFQSILKHHWWGSDCSESFGSCSK